MLTALTGVLRLLAGLLTATLLLLAGFLTATLLLLAGFLTATLLLLLLTGLLTTLLLVLVLLSHCCSPKSSPRHKLIRSDQVPKSKILQMPERLRFSSF